jgi:hypothetical protein
VRFDPVYVTHFKCDKHRISDYLNLYGFLRDIYQMPGIAETVDFDHIAPTISAAIKPLTQRALSPLARGRIWMNRTGDVRLDKYEGHHQMPFFNSQSPSILIRSLKNK